jgi:pimeloyl-ACP methyl ester carboxylesterase
MIAFHKVPESIIYPYPLIFIHGAWHDSFYWHTITDDLCKKGWEIYAIDLPGHGSDRVNRKLNLICFRDYLFHLELVLSDIGKKVILVGHSMGGMVVQKYLQKNSCVAAILMAPVPHFGVFNLVLNAIRKFPFVVLRAFLSGNLFYMINTLDKADYWLYNDEMTLEQKKMYFEHLQNESFLAFFTLLLPKLNKKNCGRISILLMAAENDKLFSIADQKATADFHKAKFVVIPNSSHNMMLSSSIETAQEMTNWLIQFK